MLMMAMIIFVRLYIFLPPKAVSMLQLTWPFKKWLLFISLSLFCTKSTSSFFLSPCLALFFFFFFSSCLSFSWSSGRREMVNESTLFYGFKWMCKVEKLAAIHTYALAEFSMFFLVPGNVTWMLSGMRWERIEGGEKNEKKLLLIFMHADV